MQSLVLGRFDVSARARGMPEITNHGKLFFSTKLPAVGRLAEPDFPHAAGIMPSAPSQSYGKESGPNPGGGPGIWSRSMKTRFRRRGTASSSSGATTAVRPDGRRRINRPSDVIPMTLLRIERVRPCGEYAAELRLTRARLDFEATDFSVLCELDWLAAVGGGSAFA